MAKLRGGVKPDTPATPQVSTPLYPLSHFSMFPSNMCCIEFDHRLHSCACRPMHCSQHRISILQRCFAVALLRLLQLAGSSSGLSSSCLSANMVIEVCCLLQQACCGCWSHNVLFHRRFRKVCQLHSSLQRDQLLLQGLYPAKALLALLVQAYQEQGCRLQPPGFSGARLLSWQRLERDLNGMSLCLAVTWTRMRHCR